jgi:apolipoprotein N-acyltransferase
VANELWERTPSARRVAAVFAAVLVAALLFGGVRLAFLAPDVPTVRVASLAPDPDLDSASQADDLFARTRQEAQAGARIVSWSEAAVFTAKQDEAALLDRAAAAAREEGIYLQVGLVSLLDTDVFPTNENRAVLFGPDGQLVWDYPKATSPLSDGNAPGPGIVPTVDTPYGRLATVICFDADMPWLVRQAGRAGADILLVPSSDWEPVAEVHSRMAIFRAVENGTALVRPTRQGTSLAVDAQGRLLGYKPDFFVGEDQTMVSNVPTRGTPTVYARLGDGIGWGSVIGLLVLAAVALRRP